MHCPTICATPPPSRTIVLLRHRLVRLCYSATVSYDCATPPPSRTIRWRFTAQRCHLTLELLYIFAISDSMYCIDSKSDKSFLNSNVQVKECQDTNSTRTWDQLLKFEDVASPSTLVLGIKCIWICTWI